MQVRYTGFRDRPAEERQVRFQSGCREGHTEIAFAATGTNLQLVFTPVASGFGGDPRECDFDKEHGKVSDDKLHTNEKFDREPVLQKMFIFLKIIQLSEDCLAISFEGKGGGKNELST